MLYDVVLCRTWADVLVIAEAVPKAKVVSLDGYAFKKALSIYESSAIDAFAEKPKNWTRGYVSNSYENTKKYCDMVDEKVKVSAR